MLIGTEALVEAENRLLSLIAPMKTKHADVEMFKEELDKLGMESLVLSKEREEHYRLYSKLMTFVEREAQRIEQFWIDDKSNTRIKFRNVCKAMETIEKDDWFTFKNHRVPPTVTKKILDACSYLLGRNDSWQDEQHLVSDSVYCGRRGDDSVQILQ